MINKVLEVDKDIIEVYSWIINKLKREKINYLNKRKEIEEFEKVTIIDGDEITLSDKW